MLADSGRTTESINAFKVSNEASADDCLIMGNLFARVLSQAKHWYGGIIQPINVTLPYPYLVYKVAQLEKDRRGYETLILALENQTLVSLKK